jgi:orotate phosphoribosyltransferase
MSEVLPKFFKRAPENPRHPYDLIFGRTSNAEQLAAMGDRIAERLDKAFGNQQLDLVTVLYTGAIVTGAATLSRSRLDLHDNTIQIIPDDPTLYGNPTGAPVVLIDNSINTGATFTRAVELLDKNHCHPAAFLKLVDYGGEREAETTALIAACDVQPLSVYTAEELAGSPYLTPLDHVRIALGSIGLHRPVEPLA